LSGRTLRLKSEVVVGTVVFLLFDWKSLFVNVGSCFLVAILVFLNGRSLNWDRKVVARKVVIDVAEIEARRGERGQEQRKDESALWMKGLELIDQFVF
jgi:hypothetical protein